MSNRIFEVIRRVYSMKSLVHLPTPLACATGAPFPDCGQATGVCKRSSRRPVMYAKRDMREPP